MKLFKVKDEEKRIFIINGSGGVGKDTFVELVNKALQDYFNFHNDYAKLAYSFSSIDVIKEAAKVIGWNGDKSEKSRKFLSDLKILSTKYNDYPHQSILHEIKRFYKDTVQFMLFIHTREPEDIERFKKEVPECKTILITNKNIAEIKSNMADANVFNYNYDIVINNDDTLEELKQKAVDFIKKEYQTRESE